jgi:carbon storage regulator
MEIRASKKNSLDATDRDLLNSFRQIIRPKRGGCPFAHESLFSAEVAPKRLFIFQGGSAMLVLSRRIGEQIVIDNDIIVTVAAVQGSRVRIGITAPDRVRIDREELRQRDFSKPWRQRPPVGKSKVASFSAAG